MFTQKYPFTVCPLRYLSNCIPPHKALEGQDAKQFAEYLSKSCKILVVTGAGISTESGLPDYRSEGVGAYARNKNFVPVLYQTFVKSLAFRQRYWLKSYLGWNNLFNSRPNKSHTILTQLESDNKLLHLITQNVDNLHRKANTQNIIELHGSAYRVICLNCQFEIDRSMFQGMLSSHNPSVTTKLFPMNPDGDVDIGEEDSRSFTVPDCPDCGGTLKPNIVFFGENVPRHIVKSIEALVKECDSLLVCGSSLTVLSSYRIVVNAVELNKPVVIVNIGKTRADSLANLKIEAKCSDVLSSGYKLYKEMG